MTYYPFTHEDQCLKCGGLPADHELVGTVMGMFPGSRYEACSCPPRKRRGKSTGRPPLARQILSEAVLRVAWRAVWRGSRGSCWAIAKRLEDGTYRPELVGTHELAVALDIDGVHYLVLWRKKP